MWFECAEYQNQIEKNAQPNRFGAQNPVQTEMIGTVYCFFFWEAG